MLESIATCALYGIFYFGAICGILALVATGRIVMWLVKGGDNR